MKLLMLAPQPFMQQRGTPLATLRAVRALTAVGHEIDLLTYHEGDPIEVPGCRHHRTPALPGLDGVPPGFSFRKLLCDVLMVACAMRLCRRNRYDVVHAIEESVFIAMAVRALFGIPYVYDMDSSLPEQLEDRFRFMRPLRPVLDFFESRALRHSAGVVAVCRALEDTVKAYGNHPPVVRVEDSSLLPASDPESRKPIAAWPEAGSRRAVMYVGNLQAYQGIDLLLDSFSSLLKLRDDTDLVVVGGSENEIRACQGRARELGISDATHFLGPRPVAQLGGLLNAADILVSPRTAGRNTPMKIFSYLDSGTPILATNLPTHTQVLDADVATLVHPEPDAMARGMNRLLSDPTLGRRLAAAARRRVATQFSGPALDRKLTGFYRELFGAPANIKRSVAEMRRAPSARRAIRSPGVAARSELEGGLRRS